jgi:uncharacterized protein (DUF885 family)
LAIAALVLSSLLAGAAPPPADALHALFRDSNEAMLRRNPIEGIARGDRRFLDRIGDGYSDAHLAAEKAADEDDLRRLHAIDRTALSPTDRIAYDTFETTRRIDLAGYAPALVKPAAETPINHFYGLPQTFADLSSGEGAAPYKTAEDYAAAMKRNAAFGGQIDIIVAQFRRGVADGIVEPKLVVRNMIDQLDAQVKGGVDGSPYAAPLKTAPTPAIATAYRQSIARDVLPPLVRLRDYLRNDYLGHARDSVGLGGMKGGPALYRHLIEQNTTLPLSPDEVHSLGLSEVARITAEMEGVKQALGFTGDLHAFFRMMSSDPKYAPPSRGWLEARYKTIGATIDAHIPQQFSLVPRTRLEIRPTPAYREKNSAGGEYMQGTADGTRPGVFYYNGYDLPTRFTWDMDTLYLHEAIPGHHFQISIAQENAALPDFMRFGGNTAYVEGWALYAETLWRELGVETDPAARFGGLNDEMLRAMRLVVDSGIHAKGWSRDQAIAYMLDHSAMGRADVVAEVERYIAIPGQALAYKVGQLTILKEKAKAEKALGTRFDPRAFHAAVLETGALPMPVLERKLDAWIAAGGAR